MNLSLSSSKGTQQKPMSGQRKRSWKKKLDDLYDSIDEKTKQLQELPQLSGPVAASLDNILKKKIITVQAYHGGSFVGNNYNTYIQATTKNICQCHQENI